MTASIELVLGGARSGKSRYAEARLDGVPSRVYLATAQALDAEMKERIAAHQTRRGADWTTLEAPLELATALGDVAGRPILVDCLTLWLTNVLLAGRDVAAEIAALEKAVTAATGQLVLVSNEVGLGLVPETPLGRAFRDWQGILNQRIGAIAQRVVFLAAGLPLVLKDTP
jgi:adenosylcobinamide kinase/adenosylcobinamide-phosphate guanylyltransferase